MTMLRVPGGVLDSLAAGPGSAAAMDLLRRAHRSRTLLLIHALGRTVPLRQKADLDPAYTLLSIVDDKAPAVVTELLAAAPVGVWARGCVEDLRAGGRPDLGYLAQVAAAAAIRAGFPATIRVGLHEGAATIPTLGTVRLDPGAETAEISVRADPVRATACAGGDPVVLADPDPAWSPMPRLAAGTADNPAGTILDDADPAHRYPGMTRPGRLSGAEVARWAAVFADGWDAVTAHPSYAAGLASGLRSIVPVVPPAGVHLSASAPENYGIAALSYIDDPAALAVSLIHEFQHAKLAVLIDAVPLYRSGRDERFYAPWREDPRPVGALLQGTYAFLAVADIWRVRRARPALRAEAQEAFALWRSRVTEATQTLRDSGLLTAAGERFVAGMAATVAGWAAEPVPAWADARAARIRVAHRRRWLTTVDTEAMTPPNSWMRARTG
jgi:HEXXH motif-containing protein